LTDYRTLWRASQPLLAVPMRVFADCPAGRRAASESAGRLESRQIGVLYSLAKSTSKCRTCPVMGQYRTAWKWKTCGTGIFARAESQAGATRVPTAWNEESFGARSRGGTAAGLRP